MFSLAKFFKMDVYSNGNGGGLWTPRVARALGLVAVLLAAQFAVDWWAFQRGFTFSFPNEWFWPVLLCTCFACIPLVVDLTYLLADFKNDKQGKKYVAIIIRLALILGIPLLTAIPVELGIFESEITRRIESEEKLAVDNIREKAQKALEFEYFGNPDATEQNMKLGKIGMLQKTNSNASNADVTQAEADLADQIASSEHKRQELKKDFDQKSACASCEASGTCDKVPGCVASGRYGSGPAFQAKQKQADEAKKSMDAFNQEADAKTELLRKERDAKVKAAREKSEGSVETLRKEYDKKVVELRDMPRETLSEKYPGDWKRSYGFLARYNELEEMAADPVDGDKVSLMIWGCRILMMLFGVGVLLAKHNLPEEVNLYLSLVNQARAGHPDAVRHVRSMKEEEIKELGFTREYFDLEVRLRQAHDELVQALTGFEQFVFAFIVTGTRGLYPTRREILVALQTKWVADVQPKVLQLEDVQQDIRQRGMTEIQVWPQWVPLADRRGQLEPWVITSNERLADHGWKDPMPLIDAASAALDEWALLIDELRQATGVLFPQQLRLYARANAKAPVTTLQEKIHPWFAQHVLPRVRQMDQVITTIQRGGLQVPTWPNDLQSLDDIRIMWRVSVTDARREGWKGPDALNALPEPLRHLDGLNGHRPTGDDLNKLITERAYLIWERDGRQDGRDQDNWNQATAEVNTALDLIYRNNATT